jgi:tripartite-type tricarboxylate transporter receptor subunit TctC
MGSRAALRLAFRGQEGDAQMPFARRRAVAAGLAASPVIRRAAGQPVPEAPLRLVVPFPPGGAVDLIARALEGPLSRSLGQAVVVENRPGGNTVIGTDHVAKAPADGSRLVFVQNSFTANAALQRNPPFDARRDFTGVAFVGYNPIILIAATTGPASLAELLAAARAAPGGIAYASFGNGSASHLAGEAFKRAARVDLLHVPYQGGAPALRDIAGGHVPLMFANLPSALPLLREGRARALGLADVARSPLAPDVPTFEEAGVPGAVAWAWFGLAARSGTPEPLLDRLNMAINRALSEPALVERFVALGLQPRVLGRAAFAAYLARAFEEDAALIRDAGIRID